VERRLHGVPDRGGIADVADPGVDLAAGAGHAGRGRVVLVAVAAPDRDAASRSGERLGDAEADAAIATSDDRDAAGQVENTHGDSFGGFPRRSPGRFN